MKLSAFLRPERLILLLAALTALPSLLDAWLHAPLEKMSGIGFLLWIVPAVMAGLHPAASAGEADSDPQKSNFPLWSGLALPALAAGAMLDLNIFHHAALALAIAGFAFVQCGNTAGGWCWLITGTAWMPAMGWLAASSPPGFASTFRLLVCAGGAAAYLISTRPDNSPPATFS
ncbi:MAG: hypothetical protein JWL81_2901 [Verrucomicrobiales bacterium]|nr:hypothetical protein [Verrucomicrobiales bacterium]